MAQKTTYTLLGIPGQIPSFSPKAGAAEAGVAVSVLTAVGAPTDSTQVAALMAAGLVADSIIAPLMAMSTIADTIVAPLTAVGIVTIAEVEAPLMAGGG
jgi:hypothetical protein